MKFDVYVTYQEEGKHYRTFISDNAGLWMLVSEFGIGTLHTCRSSFALPDNTIGKHGELIEDEMHIDNNTKMKTRYLAIGLIDPKNNFLTKPSSFQITLQKDDIPLIEDIFITKKNYKEMKQLCFNMNYLSNYDKFYDTYEYNVDNFYSMLEKIVKHLKELDSNSELFNCEERYYSEKSIANIFKYCNNKPIKN